MSTEIEIGGVTIKGGRVFVILSALGALIGTLYEQFMGSPFIMPA